MNMVYSCLDLRPKNVDYIVRKTGFSPGQVSNYLIELMLQRVAIRLSVGQLMKQKVTVKETVTTDSIDCN